MTNYRFALPLLLPALALAQLGPVTGSYNLHLEETVRFDSVKPGSDVNRGRALFGIAPDLVTEDASGALFEGDSVVAGIPIESNDRTCFTCHRGSDTNFGLPLPPLSASVALTDPLFTGMQADAQEDPDAMDNLDHIGLIKYRPNRFNPTRVQTDPYRQVFGWRKSQTLLNVGLSHGFLTDGRARVMFETARGAVFSHTQTADERFDDLFMDNVGPNPLQKGHDIEAFLFSLLTDPALAALQNPNDPNFKRLKNRPFETVAANTPMQKLGKLVFIKECYVCHNTPQVFNNVSNVEPLGVGDRPDSFPSFAPAVGRMFNIGVAERNEHNLRFTRFVPPSEGGPSYAPIIIPLANEDGSVNMHEVTSDIGLAATTGRSEDIGRFKVPQLRSLAGNAPYFHDNSASTIEEVVDYFNSSSYNDSHDGQKYPIHLGPLERFALIEFLKIL